MAPPRKPTLPPLLLLLLLPLLALLLGALPALHRPLSVAAWEQEDYEIFDLVDEVEKVAGEKENFYTLLGVEPHANLKEISSGYRKQSLRWHPDKNDSPQASRRQKLIGVVASVLRDEESRKRYDFFLQNGVPRWRGTGYYYRRHRPGLGSVLIGLAVFVSLLQYLGAWVLCVRRRSMFRDVLAEEAEAALRRMPRRSTKKTLSKGRPADDGAFDPGTPGAALPTAEDLLSEAARDPMNDPVVQFPLPSPRDVLIFQLPRAVFRALLALPGALSGAVRGLFSLGAARRRGKKGGGDSGSDSDDDGRASGARGDADARKRAAGDRPAPSKRQAAAVRRTANRRPANPKFVPTGPGESGAAAPSKEWTDADVAQLKDLTAKFPPGTTGRWALVSRALGREEREVVMKAKEIK